MQHQPEPRFKKRVPCKLTISGQHYTSLVLNVSRTGLFVQTNAGVRSGDDVRIELSMPGQGQETVPIGAQVVWRRVVPAKLRTVSTGGAGLRIRSAPESYYNFLIGVSTGVRGSTPRPQDSQSQAPRPAAEVRSQAESAPSPPLREFRVRVERDEGARSRTLTVSGANEEDARVRALARVGAGWSILELAPL